MGHFFCNELYIDGNAEPSIEANSAELVGGQFLAGLPLSSPRSKGRNLYFPIPYAKSIKITADKMWTGNPTEEQGHLYYQINFRNYTQTTQVESLTKERLHAAKSRIDNTQKQLLQAGGELIADTPHRTSQSVPAGSEVTFFDDNAKQASVVEAIAIKLMDVSDEQKTAEQLRTTLLSLTFDGKETVRVPLGDFFGSGVGLNPYRSFYERVDKDGRLVSLWLMPFQKTVTAKLVNLGSEATTFTLETLRIAPYKWSDRSLYFHANWRQERDMPSAPDRDWEYIQIVGKGVYVGDLLALVNPVNEWWGEGDEKIYVDDEMFPSHFGTGTEDYYGYAWNCWDFFESPFHAQPRVEGPANFGNTSNLRFRGLDAIPFSTRFRFDMELMHWKKDTHFNYAITAFWYGSHDAVAIAPKDFDFAEEVCSPVYFRTPPPIPAIPGFTLAAVPNGRAWHQQMKEFTQSKWEKDDQLVWTGTKLGDKLDLLITTKRPGDQELRAFLTKAIDYAIVQFWVDGEKIGTPINLFHDGVIATDEISIGLIKSLQAGTHTVTLEIVGKDDRSTNYFLGVDRMWFR